MAPFAPISKSSFATIRRRAVVAIFAWVCLPNFAVGVFLSRKEEPKGAADEFMMDQSARAFAKSWTHKHWQTTRLNKLCDDGKLPNATHEIVDRVCGNSADRNRCVCNLAKAHSCHVGCAADHFAHCPRECGHKHCQPGHPHNGGIHLSGGTTGKCYKYCSTNFGKHRYCGVGTDYQTQLYLDCTRCNPASKKEAPKPEERKQMWTSCMADCFPSPTCAEMCAEGTPECFTSCVEKYRSAVEPYYSIFQDSSTNVLDLFLGDAKTKEKSGESAEKGGGEKTVEPIELSKAKAGDGKKELEHHGEELEHHGEEELEGEEEWEDPWAEDDDDYEYEDDDFEEYSYDFMLRKARRAKHTNTMRQARSLGLVD